MFNTTHIHTSPRSIHVSQHTEVTEKRAPTDESVRLLREMEDAARQKVIDAIPVGNTDLDMKLLVEEKCGGMELEFTLLIRVNGQRRTCKLALPEDGRFMSKTDKIDALKKATAEALAVIFLTELACKPGSENSFKRLFNDQ